MKTTNFIEEAQKVINGEVLAVGGHFGLIKRVIELLLSTSADVTTYNALSDTYKKAFDTHGISTFNKYSGYYKRVALLSDKDVLALFIGKLNSTLDISKLSESELINFLPKLRATGGGAKVKVTINDRLNTKEKELNELKEKVAHAEAIKVAQNDAHTNKELLKEEQKALKAKQELQKAEELRLASLSPKDLKAEMKLKKENEKKAQIELEKLKKIENDKIEIALKKEESKGLLNIIAMIRELSDDQIMLKVASCNQDDLKGMIESLKIFIP